MKQPICLCLLALPLNLWAQGTPEAPVITPSGPHSSIWSWTVTDWDDLGRAVTNEHSYIEVATGLNFLANPATQQWERSVSAFEPTSQGGFVARRGQHRVIVAGPNPDAPGALDLELPDGQRLVGGPLCLSLFSPSSGRTVLLAQAKPGPVEQPEPNVLLVPDAFDSLAAALVFKNEISGFDQSVVLLANPGSPQDWGFSDEEAADVRLEVWTEWFDPPEPVRTTSRTAEGLESETLDFGSMRMIEGRAFFLNRELESVEVAKTWQRIRDPDTGLERCFLIEGVRHRDAAPMLERLQARATPPTGDLLARRTTQGRSALAGLLARRPKSAGEPQLARAERPAPPLEAGFLIDYLLLNTSKTNYVFKGDVVHYVSADVHLYGSNTTWEGGTILKMASNVTLAVNTPITWGGTPARPVTLTARDDPSVGESILPTNALGTYYATTALRINGATTNTLNLQNLRIRHAQTALSLDGGSGHVIRHAQIVNCLNGIAATNAEFSLRNALFHNVLTNFTGSSATGRVEHLTSDVASWLNNNIGTNLYLTNCILAGVTNLGSKAVTNAVAWVNPSGVFQSVGAGYHYLASNSPYRDYAGASTNINATLVADLRKLTTYPPNVLTNDFTANTTLSPQAQRDTGTTLDLGWHYDPLDYCWSTLNLTNATLILTNGVAVGFYGTSALTLRANAKLHCEGSPATPNRWVYYHAVQEQPVVWGGNSTIALLTENTSGSYEAHLRFTDVSFLANTSARRRLMTLPIGDTMRLDVRDCTLRGVSVEPSTTSGGSLSPLITKIAFTNNVFERPYIYIDQDQSVYGYEPVMELTFRNNLLRDGTCSLRYWKSLNTYTLPTGCALYDNLFDSVSLTAYVWYDYQGYQFRPLPNSHNAYYQTSPMYGAGTGSQTLTNASYQIGPLGNYYYPTNGATNTLTSLINAGSCNATNVGLYHFTTTTNQVKETNSVVDIGYHVVATDANGNPLDTDADGFANYFEDRNGNGTSDPGGGETDWQDGTDGDLKVWITEPKANSNLP